MSSYAKFYRLTGPAFAARPDPRFFFTSATHKRALAYLRYGLEGEAGSVIVTGPEDAGKTTLLEILAPEFQRGKLLTARLELTQDSGDDLLVRVARAFGLMPEGVTSTVHLRTLAGYFRVRRREGRKLLLVVDDAHHLTDQGLLQLQDLLAAENAGQSLLQCLLMGEERLKEMLLSPAIRWLRRSSAAAYRLNSFSLEESMAYVEHRLRRVGWRGDPVLSPLAHLEVYFNSSGLPGRISRIWERVLEDAAAEGLHEIKAETVNTNLAGLSGETE